MRVHILGICGTFMGGIAAIAKEAGHSVSGADQNVYPPMSTQLEALGIKLIDGYETPIDADVESVVVGNALSRGKPVVEALLNSGRAYTSGPEWLADYVLRDKWVLAVAGTHGKTTTTSPLPGTVRSNWWNCQMIASTSLKISAWSNSMLLTIKVRGR